MKAKNLLVLLLTFSFFIYYSLPFFHRGFFPTMDDVQVVRIDEMLRELKSGQFPVRYIDGFGQKGGYMLFNYYSPLAYYVGAGYQALVARPVKATKLVFLTAIFFGCLGMYVLLRRYTGVTTSLLGVCLFLSSAYLGFDVFRRGALAEVWGLMFFPWILWAFLKVKEKPIFAHYVVAAIFYAGAILSHIAITAFFSFFLFTIIFIPPLSKKSTKGIVSAFGIGLLLSAFFWLPLLVESKYIVYQQSEYATQQYLVGFLNLSQLIGMPHELAKIQATLGLGLFLLTLISSLYLLFVKKNNNRKLLIYLFLVLFISLLLIHPLTKPLWDHVAYLKFLQSPWRFLTISTIYAVFICSLGLSRLKKWWIQLVIVAAVVAYAIIFQKEYMRPYAYNNIPEYKAEGVCATTTWKDEYLPKWVKKCLPSEVSKKVDYPIFTDGGSTVKNISLQKNGRLITFITEGKGAAITVAKYYLPGWRVYIDGEESTLYPSTSYGLNTVKVPMGKHDVKIFLGNTWIQTVGNSLSLIGVGIVILTMCLERKTLKMSLPKVKFLLRSSQ